MTEEVRHGDRIDPSTMTLGQRLTTWIALKTVADSIRPATYTQRRPSELCSTADAR